MIGCEDRAVTALYAIGGVVSVAILIYLFVAMLKPLRLQVIGAFTPRGGITTTVTCTYPANSPR